MRFLAIVLTGLGFLATSPPARAAGAVAEPTECVLSLDLEAQVPAQEAGVLKDVPVRDGDAVSKGELLAQIDDAVPQLKQNVATFKLEVAKKQALDDVDKRYAKAGADVAQVKLDKSIEANRENPRTVSIVEVNEQRLERDKFVLAIEKAQKDLDVAGFQMQVSDAELRATEEDIKRRKIIAPFDAVVSELSRHVGEWVQQGETVMRLVRVRPASRGRLPERQGLSALGNLRPAGKRSRGIRPRTDRDLPRKDRVRRPGDHERNFPGAGRSAKSQRERLLGAHGRPAH